MNSREKWRKLNNIEENGKMFVEEC